VKALQIYYFSSTRSSVSCL